MADVFEFLNKNGLTTQDKIESLIMDKWSKRQILDFDESWHEATPIMKPVKTAIDKFRFVVNSNLSAQLGAVCNEWGCRLRSVDKLSRFAALYADSIYIQDYYVPDLKELFQINEMEARYVYAGNLKVLAYLRPLIENSIIVLVEQPTQHICPHCMAEQFPGLDKQINRANADFSSLATKYLRKTKAFIDVEDLLEYGQATVEFDGSSEIFHDGHISWVPYKVPTWMKQKIKRSLSHGDKSKIVLTEDEILKTNIIQSKLRTALDDILLQKIYSQLLRLDTTYLTDRDVDFQILNSMTGTTESNSATKNNNALTNNLLYEMPIIQDVPIKFLLKVRKDDYIAFQNFKNSMSQVVNKYIAQHKIITKRDAQQIYLDEIYPQLCKLNTKVSNIRTVAVKKLVKDIIISTSVVAIGWFSGIFPPLVKEAITGLGLLKPGKEIPESIYDIANAEDEIRNEDLYFLWKIKKNKKA
jgi:hypothetical protein